MAEVRSFRALRYDETLAGPLGDVLCPPYDVISDALRDELYARSPANFVRVEFSRPDGDPYASAAATLTEWRRSHLLRQDAAEAMYVHDHEFVVGKARLRRRGLHLALRLHSLDEGIVMPHELTFPKAKADRLALLRATRTNTSAVFGMYADSRGEIAGALDRAIGGGTMKPLAEAVVGDERHRLWAIGERVTLGVLRETLQKRRVYIADGHHRYETALTYLAERGANATDGAPLRFVLAYLCSLSDPGLRILATHRVVRANGAIDEAVARSFDASPIDRGAIDDMQPGIVLVRDGHFTQLHVRANADLSALRPAWRELPVALAEELLLKDAREAGADVTYEHDTARAIAAAAEGATAILLRAVDPQTLQRIADAGERLPQKTTYFYPKVPAGLVVRALD